MSTTGGPGPIDDPGQTAPMPGGALPPPYPGVVADPVPARPAPTGPPTIPAPAPAISAHPGTWAPGPPSDAVGWGAPDPGARYPHESPAPARRGNRPLAVLGVLMMVLAGLGALAVVGVIGYRTWTMDRLLTGIERSEAAMVTAQRAVAETAQSPQELDGEGGAEKQAALQQAAATAQDEVADAAQEIADVRIAPWDAEIERARTTYLAHNGAWQEFLEASSQDASEWFKPYPDIDRTWNTFVAQIQLAVPTPDLRDAQGRVEAIVGDTVPGGIGGGTLDV